MGLVSLHKDRSDTDAEIAYARRKKKNMWISKVQLHKKKGDLEARAFEEFLE